MQPGSSTLGLLLSLKILLAVSVLAHFIRAITRMTSGRMNARRSFIIHISVLCHSLTMPSNPGGLAKL